MTDGRRLGVVIVAYRHPESTERCLRSIAGDPSAVERDVVVVDNSPRDEPGTAARPDGARVLPRPDNPGYGAAANAGVAHLRETRDDHLGYLVLNHDVELLPGFLDAAAGALAADGVGAASGAIFLDRADEDALWYAGGGIRYLTGTVRQSRDPADAATERDVEFIPGTAVAVSRRAWREISGFDPRIFLYHEDLDLCRRLRRAGWTLRFRPGMRAVHHMGVSTGSRRYSAFYLEHLTRTRFVAWRSTVYRLYLAAVHTAWVGVRSVRLLRNESLAAGGPKVRSLWRGHLAALGGLFVRRRTEPADPAPPQRS